MHVDLKQTQRVMGSVNDLAQMCPFLKFYKGSGNNMLSRFGENENILLPVPIQVKEDLMVAARVALTAMSGLPLADRKCAAPLSALEFRTDAAGGKFVKQNGIYIQIEESNRGVSCIGGEDETSVWVWTRFCWPKNFLLSLDEKGKCMGRKSTTLECFGLLLPFIAFPEKIAGRYLRFWIDNISVHYGWRNGYVKEDASATHILKCVNILSSFLGCQIEVRHEKRVSTSLADLADEISRKSNSTNEGMATVLNNAEFREVKGCIANVTVENLPDLHIGLLKELRQKIDPMM